MVEMKVDRKVGQLVVLSAYMKVEHSAVLRVAKTEELTVGQLAEQWAVWTDNRMAVKLAESLVD